MTEQESINQTLQRRIDTALSEIKQQREDMRRLWDRQDDERRARDAEMKEMNKKIDDNFKTLSNQIHNNFLQTMVGFGAIAAAVGGIVIAAFK